VNLFIWGGIEKERALKRVLIRLEPSFLRAMTAKNNSRTARVARPHRSQVEMQLFSLDQMLPGDHRARVVWAYVQSLDLEAFYSTIEVNDNTPGRPAIAPEILVSLWLLATLDGIGIARELDRRCETDIAYLWLLGTVRVNYHTLSDFRVQHGALLERLLVETITVLIHGGLVPLETIAQDGMRVRASAGSSSFRRRPTLEKLQKEAQEHVDRLKKEADNEFERQAARRAARRLSSARRGNVNSVWMKRCGSMRSCANSEKNEKREMASQLVSARPIPTRAR
jgi:transposase